MILSERYEYNPKEDRLGKGGFGSVYRAFDKIEQRVVALKFVQKSAIPERYSLFEELTRIKSLIHPNLIKYFDSFSMEYHNVSGEMDEMQIGVMEYANGGDLGAFMKVNSSKKDVRLRPILIGILEGLDFLHQHKIIHRDIKPQNILLHIEEGKITPKISDFSISKLINSEMTSVSAAVGTYEYMSPEQLGKTDAKIGVSTDIWSFGVLTYYLLTGELPFGSRRKGDTDGKIVANIINPDVQVDVSNLPSPYQEIIATCLKKNTEDRFKNIREIIDLLKTEKEKLESPAVMGSLLEAEIEDDLKTENTISQDEEAADLHTQTVLPDNLFEIADSLVETIEEDEKSENQYVKEKAESISFVSQEITPSEKPESENVATDQKYHSSNTSKLPVEDKKASRMALIIVLVLLVMSTLYVVYYYGFYKKQQNKTISQQEDTLSNADNEKKPQENNEVIQDQKTEKNEKLSTNELNTPVIHHKKEESTVNKEDKNRNDEKISAKPENEKHVSKNAIDEKKTDVSTKKEEISDNTPGRNYTPPVNYEYQEERELGTIVVLKGKYGFLNKTGETIVPTKYEDFAYFTEGLAAVKLNGKWGYVNTSGQWVIAHQFDRMGNFSGGLAEVSKGNKTFFINKKGACVKNCN